MRPYSSVNIHARCLILLDTVRYAHREIGFETGNIVTGMVVGACIGLAQGFVLKKRTVLWIFATSISFSIGFALAGTISDELNWIGVAACTGLMVGAFTGLAQGLVWELKSASFARWVRANTAGYTLGYVLGNAVPTMLTVGPGPRPLFVPSLIGITVGFATWLALRNTILAENTAWMSAKQAERRSNVVD